MSNKKVILSAKDISVEFQVRNRTLRAIRNISVDLHEGETLALVGESGSGKSVFTKVFTGMLETNGSVSTGTVTYGDMNLTNLKTLNLSDNILIELPKTIGDLTNVENLFLSGNNLKKLPKNIVNLKNLKWLSLLDNKDLILEEEQKKWIQSLQNNGCKVFLEK